MKVGCYTLDLYCDSDRDHPWWYEFPKQFMGKSEQPCIRQARKAGWKVGEDRQLCPLCTGAITEKQAEDQHYGRRSE